MTEILGNVHCSLQHHHAEGYPGDPADKADDAEDTKYGEDHCGWIVVLGEIINGGANAKNYVEYSSDPDELFGESACQGKV